MHFKGLLRVSFLEEFFWVEPPGWSATPVEPRRDDSGEGGATRRSTPLRLLTYPPRRAECGSRPAEVISPALNLVNAG